MENTTSNNQRNKIGTIGFIISLITLVLFGTSLVFFLSSVPWVGLLFLVVLLFWLLGFILSAIGLGKKPIGLAIAGVAISLLVIFIAFNQNVYNAIYQVNKTIDFETEKKQRYTEVIKKLKDANMDYSVLQDQPNILIMTNDFGSIYANCKGDDKTLMNQVLALANLTKTLNFLVIDSATNIKKYRYDEWYTNFIDAKEGIYVGNNIGTATPVLNPIIRLSLIFHFLHKSFNLLVRVNKFF